LFDPEVYKDEVDDEEFLLGELPSVGDGDQGGIPARDSVDLAPPECEIGEQLETVFNGSYLLITSEGEADLVRFIEKSGKTALRDDELINQLGAWPDGH